MISILHNLAQTNNCRLPPFPPYHSGLISPHHSSPHPLEYTNGEPDTHLASDTNPDRRHPYGRRMAVLGHALSPYSPMGEHCSFPQTYPVAHLLLNGPHD